MKQEAHHKMRQRMWTFYNDIVQVQNIKVSNEAEVCKNSTRNSSEDEIANVNFLYDFIVHTLQNTIDSCINNARDRRGYVFERWFTKVSEIMQCNGIYAIQGPGFWYQSKTPIRLTISD